MKKLISTLIVCAVLISKANAQCAGIPLDGKKPISGSTLESVLSFNIKHTFTVTPGGVILPLVNAISYNHAWVNETNLNCATGVVNPPLQPVGFLETGRDTFVQNNIMNNGVIVNYKITPVSPSGLLMTDSAFAWSCQSRSRGNSCISINPYGLGSPVSGVIQNYGFSQSLLPPQTSQADAISLGDVTIQSGKLLKNGTIMWGPVMESVVGGKAHIIRQKAGTHDPIEYFIHDYTTNNDFSGKLLDINMNFYTSNDTTIYENFWRNDSVYIESDTAEFEIDFPSPTLTSLAGHLLVRIENGAVTASTGTGIFTGIPPLVGTLTPVYFQLQNLLQFSYNLGNFGNDSLLVKLNMYGYSENNDVPASVVINVGDSTNSPKCNNGHNGSIYLKPSGGFAPYTYLWSDFKTTKNRTNLASGSYVVTVTDKFGFSTVRTIFVPNPPPLSIVITKVKVKCFGGSSGSASATVAGGIPPYQYLWSNLSTNFAITNLIVGTYTVTVTDHNGCSKTKSVVVTSNPPLTLNVISEALDIATAVGGGGLPGLPGYAYKWFTTPNQLTATATGLLIGNNYQVKVTDSKGCTATVMYMHHFPKMAGPNSSDFDVMLSPNPTSGTVKVHIENPVSTNYSFKLHDITGRLLFDKEIESYNNDFEFDFSEQQQNIYILTISNGDKLKSLKLVIK